MCHTRATPPAGRWCSIPTGRFLLVHDKGLDTVFVCRIDAHGEITVHSHARTREGAGPRHVAFHPTLPVVYSIDELSSTVTVFDWDVDAGQLTRSQILPSTAPEDTDDTRGAEIVVHPGGRFVYASNRRGAGDHTPGGPDSDTIAIYHVDPASGRLTHAGWQPTGGIRPRHFTLDHDGSRLYVAHERSHTIDTHSIDPDTGALMATGEIIDTASPVCVVFTALG